MFAIVSFNLAGNFYSTKTYVFKTDVKTLVYGDVVVVEGENPGENSLAVFIEYKKENSGNQHKSLLKKAHKNTLKSLMKKRVEALKNIKIAQIYFDNYKTKFKDNNRLSDLEVKQKIIRNLCVSPILPPFNQKTTRYLFGSMRISLKNNEIVYLMRAKNKIKWVRPRILEEIADKYINQVFEKEEVGV